MGSTQRKRFRTGLFVAAIGLLIYARQHTGSSHAEVATARVCAHRVSEHGVSEHGVPEHGSNERWVAPVLCYEAAGRRAQHELAAVASSGLAPAVGTPMRVRVSAADPSDVRAVGFVSDWLGSVVWLAFGLFLLATSLLPFGEYTQSPAVMPGWWVPLSAYVLGIALDHALVPMRAHPLAWSLLCASLAYFAVEQWRRRGDPDAFRLGWRAASYALGGAVVAIILAASRALDGPAATAVGALVVSAGLFTSELSRRGLPQGRAAAEGAAGAIALVLAGLGVWLIEAGGFC